MKNDLSISGNSAIAELNRVPGFDPMKYVRMTENGAVLDLPYKKLWFRLKHPNGITKTAIVRLTEQVAIMEARVFFDRNDTVPAATSTAQVEKSKGNEKNFVNLAQNTALDAALSDAGFGIQFVVANPPVQAEIKKTPTKAETPRTVPEPPKAVSTPAVAKTVPAAQPAVSAATVQPAPPIATASVPDTVSVAVKETETVAAERAVIPAQTVTEEKAETILPIAEPSAVPVAAPAVTAEPAKEETAGAPTYTAETPVDDIISQMSVEDAENYVVKEGVCAGWTMKKVMERRKASIKWYCTGYNGKDNILRAAATILFDKMSAEEAA